MSEKIKFLKVTAGVFWVEVPSEGIRILCGAPADTVKHLTKKGLIGYTEKNGVKFETGPNMILLSDIMIQNSTFSNLAEFPVLQMLYRQGLIIPNHPNNTGAKPILIGEASQIDTQLNYIYRGNYGLVSEEELLEAGATPEFAKEIFRMKLKFAFGKMRPTHELIDRIDLEANMKTHIKGKLFIQRTDTNVFEFSYQSERVTVDLNLKHKETYPKPYHLGASNLRREYFSIIHTGEGDGWDTERPCMGSIITFQGKIFLIDAGPNIMFTLDSLGISVNEIDGLFQTHAHDDHFAGITSLIQSDHKINFYASAIVRHSVFKKLSLLLDIDIAKLDNFFEIEDLELDEWNIVEGLEVKPILSPHPIETNLFFIRAMTPSGYKSYYHMADIVSLDVLSTMVSDDESSPGISREFCERTKIAYLQWADIKKVDIGGGMIHGQSKDFRGDKSKKLIFSHTQFDLTKEQKQIGSSSSFGIIDILSHSEQDFNYYYASEYLRSYFGNAKDYAIKMLLNNPIVSFNPHTILIKEFETNPSVYIILTGNVEMIQSDFNIENKLTAGAIIGMISGMLEIPSNETFRTEGYVNALVIPARQFYDFLKKQNLTHDIESIQHKMEFLQKTDLFGEFISYKKLGLVSNAMVECYKEDLDSRFATSENLFLIQDGEVKRYNQETMIQVLKSGDFFNEDKVLFDEPEEVRYVFSDDIVAYEIPKAIVLEIPIVYWKAYEYFKKCCAVHKK